MKLNRHHQDKIRELPASLPKFEDGHLRMAMEEDFLSINYRMMRIELFKSELEKRTNEIKSLNESEATFLFWARTHNFDLKAIRIWMNGDLSYWKNEFDLTLKQD